MKRVRVAVCLFVLVSASLSPAQDNSQPSVAQPKPNMSGVWMIDVTQSDFGKRNARLSTIEVTLVIAHHEPQLKVTRKMVAEGRKTSKELTLHTDGHGKSHLIFNSSRGTAEYLVRGKAKSAWEGQILRTKGIIEYHAIPASNVYFMGAKESWELAPDGNTLTLTSSYGPVRAFASDVFVGDQYFENIKRVFKRVP